MKNVISKIKTGQFQFSLQKFFPCDFLTIGEIKKVKESFLNEYPESCQ